MDPNKLRSLSQWLQETTENTQKSPVPAIGSISLPSTDVLRSIVASLVSNDSGCSSTSDAGINISSQNRPRSVSSSFCIPKKRPSEGNASNNASPDSWMFNVYERGPEAQNFPNYAESSSRFMNSVEIEQRSFSSDARRERRRSPSPKRRRRSRSPAGNRHRTPHGDSRHYRREMQSSSHAPAPYRRSSCEHPIGQDFHYEKDRHHSATSSQVKDETHPFISKNESGRIDGYLRVPATLAKVVPDPKILKYLRNVVCDFRRTWRHKFREETDWNGYAYNIRCEIRSQLAEFCAADGGNSGDSFAILSAYLDNKLAMKMHTGSQLSRDRKRKRKIRKKKARKPKGGPVKRLYRVEDQFDCHHGFVTNYEPCKHDLENLKAINSLLSLDTDLAEPS